MGLDLWDAIRGCLVVELESDGVCHRLEPYECVGHGAPLRAYVLVGPQLGWRQFSDWSNLKITNSRFEPRKA